jgi:hypothetical protein
MRKGIPVLIIPVLQMHSYSKLDLINGVTSLLLATDGRTEVLVRED